MELIQKTGRVVFLLALGSILAVTPVRAQDGNLESLLSENGGNESGVLQNMQSDTSQSSQEGILESLGNGGDSSDANQDSGSNGLQGGNLSRKDLLKRGNQIQNKLLKNPETQAELNTLINTYVKQQYSDLFYTRNTSQGDMNILLQNTKLYQGNKLQFVVVQKHINEALDFKNADYTWTVKRGEELVMTKNGTEKTGFHFTPQETGPHLVRVDVDFPNGTTKTGTLSFDVYERTNIDYRPFDPGKGDIIKLRATRRFPDSNVVWRMDGDIFARGTYEPSFQEFKGYGGSYNIDVSVKDRESGNVRYYGETTIRIKKPSVHVRASETETGQEVAIGKDTLVVGEDKKITFQARPKSFPTGKTLNHIFRVNGDIKQDGPQSEFTLDVKANARTSLEVTTQAGEQGVVATRTITINPNKKSRKELAASVGTQTDGWFSVRHTGLFVLFTVMGLGMVLSKVR